MDAGQVSILWERDVSAAAQNRLPIAVAGPAAGLFAQNLRQLIYRRTTPARAPDTRLSFNRISRLRDCSTGSNSAAARLSTPSA